MMRTHTGQSRALPRIVAALAVAIAALVPLTIQAPAHAAWTPNVSPLHTGSGEWVDRNLSTSARNEKLKACGALWFMEGYACIAAGEGDGEHSVFYLQYCNTRSLSNFIDAGAAVNHQTGGARVHFWGSGKDLWVPANPDTIYTFNPYPYNYVDLC